ncbi:hypothetical protein [Bosea sp. UNC402CLCol]|uniref:hypothetical protein n=1 Tax=Bosea sp. UNC402CLCol TaxID=1510531 RepID=UPI00056FBC2E|nr:hypothetical protein [Bosea sp. UNC402CLCol]
MTTRRHFLALSLAGASLALLPSDLSPALAQAAPIGSIRVEFARTVTDAWGDNVRLVSAELQRTLAQILGPEFRQGAGNRLVVTVRSLWLASYAGGGGGGKPADGGASNDYLESTVTLYDSHGRALNSWPIMSTELSGGAGAWYLPDVDQRRLKALARNNAYWIKRYVAG